MKLTVEVGRGDPEKRTKRSLRQTAGDGTPSSGSLQKPNQKKTEMNSMELTESDVLSLCKGPKHK